MSVFVRDKERRECVVSSRSFSSLVCPRGRRRDASAGGLGRGMNAGERGAGARQSFSRRFPFYSQHVVRGRGRFKRHSARAVESTLHLVRLQRPWQEEAFTKYFYIWRICMMEEKNNGLVLCLGEPQDLTGSLAPPLACRREGKRSRTTRIRRSYNSLIPTPEK